MKTKFSWTMENLPELLVIRLSGLLDEDVKIAAPHGTFKEVQVDFEHVTGINSSGIREWLRFLLNFQKDTHFVYLNCHPNVLDQINIVQGFARPGTEIRTFYVTIACAECGHVEEAKSSTKGLLAQGPPHAPCPRCGKDLAFDGSNDYFDFLASA